MYVSIDASAGKSKRDEERLRLKRENDEETGADRVTRRRTSHYDHTM